MEAIEFVTSDKVFRVCPYCGHKCRVASKDESPERREEQCVSCGKKYWAGDDFSVVDHLAFADCRLNDLEHEFRPGTLVSGEWCKNCGKWKEDVDNGRAR